MTLDEINDLVTEIQQLLVTETAPSEEELMDLAGRHEDLILETTKRLKSVDGLLQKGLRSEAIELAEREPNLNEVVIALDFPELDAWNELLASYEMQSIPVLPEGVAADLNDAYGVSAPVERLLQKHRTAALSRAPISQRLQILRRLATADKSNPAWPQDVRDFEKYRLTEVRTELDTAIRDKNVRELAVLDEELQSSEWSTPVPADLKKKVTEAHSKVRKASSRTEMEALAYQLSDAFAEFDLDSARGIGNRFQALNKIVGLSPSDSLMDIAGPALDWVRDEQLKESRELQYQANLVAIENAIDNGAPAAELERLYYETTRHDQSLPDRLQIRLTDRLETLRVMAVRRRRTMIGLSAAFMLMIVVAVGLSVQYVRARNSIERHKTQLAGLFEDAESSGTIEPLEEYFQLLSEESKSVSQAAELVGLKQQFESLKLREQGRKEQISELLAMAAAGSEKAVVPGDFDSVFDSLKAASDLTKNDSERTPVLKSETSIRDKQTEIQKRTDDAFREKLQSLTDRIAQLPKDDVAPYDTLGSELTALSKSPDVSAGLLNDLQALQSKMQTERTEVSRGLEVARSLQSVTNAVGDANLFIKEMQNYGEQYPGTSRARDFARVVQSEQELISGAMMWNKIRDGFLAIDFRTLSPNDAKKLVDEFAQFQKSSGPYPGSMDLGDRLLILQALAKRRSGADGIKTVFDGKAISAAYMIETSDERERFYSDSAPLFDKKMTFDYYTTPGGDQTVNKEYGLTAFPDAQKKSRDAWLSPQTKLAQALVERAENAGVDDFENTIRITADRILTDEPKLDPILRMLLVERVIELGNDGSHFIATRTKKIVAAFANGGVPRLTNWVAFQDAQNRKLREIAKDFLGKNSEEISKALADAESDRDAARNLSIGPPVQWIGWLVRNEVGSKNWEVRLKSSIKPGGEGKLFTLTRQSPTAKPELTSVGTLENGLQVTVDERIEATLPVEGRPVILILAAKPKPQ